MKGNQFLLLALELLSFAFVKSDQILGCSQPNTIALTFDDGPYQSTAKLLDLLDANPDVKVTFFINAQNYDSFNLEIEQSKANIKRAYKSGHQIASHTYHHTILNSTEITRSELTSMDDFVYELIQEHMNFARAPTGECAEGCMSVVNELGYRLVNWDTDTNDWQNHTSSEASINYLTEQFALQKPNYLILMHDPVVPTVSTLVPWILDHKDLRQKYKFVTVAECVGDVPYKGSNGIMQNTTQPINNLVINNSTQAVSSAVNNYGMMGLAFVTLLVGLLLNIII